MSRYRSQTREVINRNTVVSLALEQVPRRCHRRWTDLCHSEPQKAEGPTFSVGPSFSRAEPGGNCRENRDGDYGYEG
jgi:hypothetical protein